VIVTTGDEQQRRAVVVAIVDLRYRVRIQQSESSIPKDAVGCRDLKAIVLLPRCHGVKLIRERKVNCYTVSRNGIGSTKGMGQNEEKGFLSRWRRLIGIEQEA
jgi:hypothetical protein